MSPPLTALGPTALPPSHSPPPPLAPPPTGLGLGDSQAAAAEVVSYFTAGLLNLTQSVLQARTPPYYTPPLPTLPLPGSFTLPPHSIDWSISLAYVSCCWLR